MSLAPSATPLRATARAVAHDRRCAVAARELAFGHSTSSWGGVAFERDRHAARSGVLPQRETFPLIGHEDAREVGVSVEHDSEHVVRLAFREVRTRVCAGER